MRVCGRTHTPTLLTSSCAQLRLKPRGTLTANSRTPRLYTPNQARRCSPLLLRNAKIKSVLSHSAAGTHSTTLSAADQLLRTAFFVLCYHHHCPRLGHACENSNSTLRTSCYQHTLNRSPNSLTYVRPSLTIYDEQRFSFHMEEWARLTVYCRVPWPASVFSAARVI